MFFFFNDTATTEIYTLSLHDALPISGLLQFLQGFDAVAHVPLNPEVPGDATGGVVEAHVVAFDPHHRTVEPALVGEAVRVRSEEHTSELQSQSNLVCRLLLEKKNTHI